MTRMRTSVILFAALPALAVISLHAQPPKPSEPVERLGPTQYRVGRVHVDTALRQVSVAGHINAVSTLEFVANTRGGFKAYESAITLDTDGVDFNVGLLLIGLDVTNARVPTRHFDVRFLAVAPEGAEPVRSEESLDLQWFSWDELPEGAAPELPHLLEAARARMGL